MPYKQICNIGSTPSSNCSSVPLSQEPYTNPRVPRSEVRKVKDRRENATEDSQSGHAEATSHAADGEGSQDPNTTSTEPSTEESSSDAAESAVETEKVSTLKIPYHESFGTSIT